MDVQMPLMDGIDATAEITQQNSSPSVIVLTVSSASNDVLDAIAAGAAGYLLKGASAEEIHGALRAVGAGRSPLSPEVTGTLLQHVRTAGVRDAGQIKLPELSEREQELLRLLARGADNNEIASELFLSPATVKSNMSALFEKLGVKSRVQAAVLAVRAGLA
jgi:DNA-binding NarL/FixJ family response regulator